MNGYDNILSSYANTVYSSLQKEMWVDPTLLKTLIHLFMYSIMPNQQAVPNEKGYYLNKQVLLFFFYESSWTYPWTLECQIEVQGSAK